MGHWNSLAMALRLRDISEISAVRPSEDPATCINCR